MVNSDGAWIQILLSQPSACMVSQIILTYLPKIGHGEARGQEERGHATLPPPFEKFCVHIVSFPPLFALQKTTQIV